MVVPAAAAVGAAAEQLPRGDARSGAGTRGSGAHGRRTPPRRRGRPAGRADAARVARGGLGQRQVALEAQRSLAASSVPRRRCPGSDAAAGSPRCPAAPSARRSRPAARASAGAPPRRGASQRRSSAAQAEQVALQHIERRRPAPAPRPAARRAAAASSPHTSARRPAQVDQLVEDRRPRVRDATPGQNRAPTTVVCGGRTWTGGRRQRPDQPRQPADRAVQLGAAGRQVALQVGLRPGPLDPERAHPAGQGRPRDPLDV